MPHSSLRIRTPLRTCTFLRLVMIRQLSLRTRPPRRSPPAALTYLRPRPTDHPLPPLRTCPGGAWNYDNVAPYVSTRSCVPAPSPHRPSTAAPAYLRPRPTDHPLPPLRTCALAPPIIHCRPYVPAPSPHRSSTAAPAYLPDPFYVTPHPFLRRSSTICTYLFDKSF